MGLAELIQRHKPLLDRTFGAGDYEVIDTHEHACIVRAASVEVNLAYDWRDRWVASDLRPLDVPEDSREMHIAETWVRFLGKRLPVRRKSVLNDQQARDELLLVSWLVEEIFSDPQRARDAANFCAGYGAAYNDHYDGQWRPAPDDE